MKLLEFSRVRSTSDTFYVFNSRDEIFLVFTPKKVYIFFLFYTFYRLYAMSHPLKNAKSEKKLANPNNFSTKIFDTF